MTKSNSKNVPVFWGHGKADPVVQYECESITSFVVRELNLQMGRDRSNFLQRNSTSHSYLPIRPSRDQESGSRVIPGWVIRAVTARFGISRLGYRSVSRTSRGRCMKGNSRTRMTDDIQFDCKLTLMVTTLGGRQLSRSISWIEVSSVVFKG
jgi:hypothetical protein